MLNIIALAIAFLFPAGTDWEIPVSGNVFRIAPQPGGETDNNGLILKDPDEVWSIFFHVDRPAELQLSLDARTDKSSELQITTNKTVSKLKLTSGQTTRLPIGSVTAAAAGYVRVDLQGLSRTGADFGRIGKLRVTSTTPELRVDFVRNNKGNMFYWGRRGPSVHLTYSVPKDLDLEYAYSELVVAPGDDQIGSYFMANGFSEGYFGMQVNSATERRVLFSVWSPYSTDNPKEIPEDQRVVALARGPEVRIGEFGNEGAGGQSYLVYPWKAGSVCRFLTRVQPDSDNHTIYTCWFSDGVSNDWRLIASFRRPKTQTHLKGFHSFLENFNPSTGHLTRGVRYQNVQVRDTQGRWHSCSSARFSTDATGSQKHRLDFTGGASDSHFFLRNCGFFANDVQPGAVFDLPTPSSSPSAPLLPLQSTKE
jgi:hypothetical protein